MIRTPRKIVRRLTANKTFSVTAVVTLALGIAANVAVFSVVRNVLLEPLPFNEPDRLIALWHTAPGLEFDRLNQCAALHYTELDESKVYESVAMWSSGVTSVTGDGTPREANSLSVTAELLPLLQVDAALGRRFVAEDDLLDAPLTAMLSHGYWQERFSGDPDAIGKTIRVAGRDRTILGVLPQDFEFLDQKVDLVLPEQHDLSQTIVGMFNYEGIGRLRPGVTLEQANEDINRMLPIALERYPGGLTAQILEEARFAGAVTSLDQSLVGDISRVLWILFASVGLVFLIACANVANLFLVRAESRQQELAVRSALGASNGTIARELIKESLILGLLGGALGLPIAWGLLRLLRALDPASLPRIASIGITPTVVAFTLGLSLLAGLCLDYFRLFGRSVRSLLAWWTL